MNVMQLIRSRNIIVALIILAMVGGSLLGGCGRLRDDGRDGPPTPTSGFSPSKPTPSSTAVVADGAPTATGWPGANDNPPIPTRTVPAGATQIPTKPPLPGQTRPIAPANLRVISATASQIRLAWDDLSNNEDGFQVFQEGQSAPLDQTGPNDTQTEIGNVSCGKSYNFRVRAFNTVSASSYTNIVTAQTPACTGAATTGPTAPANLRVVSTTATSVRLAWEDRSNNEDGFQVFQEGQNTPVGQTGPNETQAQIDNLTCAKSIAFRVRAFNAAGNSGYSNIVQAQTAQCGGAATPVGSALAAPANLRVVSTTATSARLAWEDRSNNEDGFQVFHEGQNTPAEQTGPNETQAQIGNLTCGKSFAFRVRAFNAAGTSGYSNIVQAQTAQCGGGAVPAVPAAPSGLNLGTQTFNLSGFTLGCNDNSENEEGFYLYVEAANAGARRTTVPANPGKGGFTIKLHELLPGAFQCGQTYQFQVSAFNAAGESARSNQYSHTVRCQ
jgi:uncharacterized protein